MATSERMLNYKNRAKSDKDEVRRKREAEGIQLRKQKRDEQVFKRRNLTPEDLIDDPTAQINSDSEEKRPTLEELKGVLPNLLSKEHAEQLYITQEVRRMLSKEPNPPIDEVIQTGAVPIFVQMLHRNDSLALQFEAAWALTNIASGTNWQTGVVVEANAVQSFTSLLHSGHVEVQEQAVWALGNISGDGPQFRDYVLNCDVLPSLLKLALVPNRPSMTKNIVWAISNLCRGKVPPPDFEKVKHCLPVLARLLFHSDADILTDACWALSYLSDGSNDKIQAVIDSGVCRRVVELLSHTELSVVSSALRTVGNIVTGDDVQTQIVLNCSILPALEKLLTSPKESIAKESCWTISNIVAGNRTQIQQVINANVFSTLIFVLSTADFKTRKEAAWAITNATSGGSSEQIRHLIKLGCISPLCDLLSIQEPKILLVALSGLDNILRLGTLDAQNHEDNHNPYALMMEECRGVDKLEYLQTHSNQEIYKKAFEMLETFFAKDDDLN
ncbi:importin subunit alpha-6-like [Styela clava]